MQKNIEKNTCDDRKLDKKKMIKNKQTLRNKL